MQAMIDELAKQAAESLGQVSGKETLASFWQEYLSKNGKIPALMKNLRTVAPEERPAMGKIINELKTKVQAEYDAAAEKVKAAELAARNAAETVDITMPAKIRKTGNLHPITLVKNEIKDVYFVQNYDLPEGKIGELTDIHMKETGTAFRSTNVGFGWDAMQVLASAMLQAKEPTDGEEVRGILENNTKDVESCGGEMITIDPSIHRPTRDMKMYIASYDDSGALVYLDLLSSDYKAN